MQTAVPVQPITKPSANGVATRRPSRKRFPLARWLAAVITLALIATVAVVRLSPQVVVVGTPESATMAETIASSGIAQGHTEVTVGAQVQGIVTKVFVEEGTVVRSGQILARVQDNVAQQQIDQASRALATAQAVLAQSAARPMASEFASAEARISQCQAAIQQQSNMIDRARVNRRQAAENIRQAQLQAQRSEAARRQAESRLDLAKKSLDRATTLLNAGAIPQASVDEAQSSYDVATQDLESAKQAASAARLSITTARDTSDASAKDVDAAQSALAAAKAQLQAAQSDLKTLQSHPRPEDVAVAQERVREAEAAVASASVQASNTDVFSPFAGTVTQIIAQPGSSPSAGVVRLVQTGRLEIKLDLDEANLRDIHPGQRAVISTPSGQYKDVAGHVDRLGSQIDSQRGTLEVYVVTNEPAKWLHPGQTLNVNVVTVEKAQRLLVPSAAIQREGDQTQVYVVENGKAKARPVLLGLISDDQITVLDGLKPTDQVIQNSYQIVDGMKVAARK